MRTKCPYCGTWSDTTAGHAAADCPMKPIDNGIFTYPAEVIYQRRDELTNLRSQLTAAEERITQQSETIRKENKRLVELQERIKELEGVISPEGYTVADELVYYKELCKAMGDEITHLREGLEYYKDPEKLARLFHSLYESFSQLTGWMTQAQCHTQFDSLPEENKKAMLKTCRVIAAIARQTLEGKDG